MLFVVWSKKKKKKGGVSGKSDSLNLSEFECAISLNLSVHPKWNEQEMLIKHKDLLTSWQEQEILAIYLFDSKFNDSYHSTMKMCANIIFVVIKYWTLARQMYLEVLNLDSLENCDYLQALVIKAKTLILRSIAPELKSVISVDYFTVAAGKLIQLHKS